jgi:hypothetical protein
VAVLRNYADQEARKQFRFVSFGDSWLIDWSRSPFLTPRKICIGEKASSCAIVTDTEKEKGKENGEEK